MTTTSDIVDNTLHCKDPSATLLGVAKKVVTSPNTERMVTLGPLPAGLYYLSRHLNTLMNSLMLPTSWTFETFHYKSIFILIGNSTTKSTRRPQHRLVAVGTDLPEMVFYFRPDDISSRREKSADLVPEKKRKQNSSGLRLEMSEKKKLCSPCRN